jgi:hypothetical protein
MNDKQRRRMREAGRKTCFGGREGAKLLGPHYDSKSCGTETALH